MLPLFVTQDIDSHTREAV